MTTRVDVVVIGLGPGGERAAQNLAQAGLEVVGVEERLVGGECPYYGCVPSKMMIRAANLVAETRRAATMAGRAQVEPDLGPAHRRIRDEATDDWNDRTAVERLERLGGRFVRGTGVLDGPGRVRVGDQVFDARLGVVLATGTAPAIPPIQGLAGLPFWTNRDAVRAEVAPRSLVVLGGGGIGAELAQAFRRFGSEVAVVESADRLLGVEEPESSALVQQVFDREGIDVRLGVSARSARSEGADIVLDLADGSTVRGERLLVATGRRPNLRGIGLATVGLDESAHSVPVDDRMRAGDRLWAIGDIAGHGAFTHLAVYHADIAVADLLGRPHAGAEYRATAWVTFTDPEIGRVGKSEEQARAGGADVRAGCAEVATSARGWIHGLGNDGFIKLVADARREVLVGATSAGPWGGEVLSMLALAVHAELPVTTLESMIYAYPTFHRGVLDALTDLGRSAVDPSAQPLASHSS